MTKIPSGPGLDEVDREERHERDRQHDGRDHGGAGVVVLFQLDDDQNGCDLRHVGRVPRDEDHRPVLTPPTARAKASVKPVRTAGTRGGKSAVHTARVREAPSVAAASSSSRSISAMSGWTVRTANGRPTKTSATKMPSGVNAIFRPSGATRLPIQPFGA